MAYADLYFGASRTGKTTQIGKAAQRAKRIYGGSSRLVTADLGTLDTIQADIDEGIIKVWNLRNNAHVMQAIDKACQGYWPQDMDDPNSPLMAPTIITYVGKCTKCGETATGSRQGQQGPCSKCKNIVTFNMVRAVNPNNDLTKVSLYAFEGITSFCDGIMDEMSSEGSVALGDKEAPLSYMSGETKFSGNSGGDFGLTQKTIPTWVARSTSIPNIKQLIWTGLEGRGFVEGTDKRVDDGKGRTKIVGVPMYGVLIPGGGAAAKVVGKIPSMFRHMLHFETVEKAAKAADGGPDTMNIEYRMYTKPHSDPMGIVFVCGLRIRSEFQAEFNKWPAWMEPDVGKLYDKIDELQQRATQQVKEITK